MRIRTKLLIWLGLNLLWLGIVAAATLLYGFSRLDGPTPHFLFQGGINETMQVLAGSLQYKSVGMWPRIIEEAGAGSGVRFHLVSLDPEDVLHGLPEVPQRVMDTAWRLPRPRIQLCPGPAPSWNEIPVEQQEEMQSGFLQSLNALYLKEDGKYWYGRPLLLPDDIYEQHYMLLAASSPSFTGEGLYFHLTEPLLFAAACLLLSLFWWYPFILLLTRPVSRLTSAAERIADDRFTPELLERDRSALFPGGRGDELGRLSDALDTMARSLLSRMAGQKLFLRQIAHEMGAPISRAKFGLEILENKVPEAMKSRVDDVIADVELASELMQDVLAYLRSEGTLPQAEPEVFHPAETIRSYAGQEGCGCGDVEFDLPEDLPPVLADRECFRRALCNVVRNAVRYAGGCGPITVSARVEQGFLAVSVADRGPGVGEDELQNLEHPFFRGRSGAAHPGGSGLGLSIVRQCMERCGGAARYANAHPGFVATLLFPLADAGRHEH